MIPVRNWPADRIDACVRSFLRLKSKALDEIVVVDFGSKPPLKLPRAGKSVRVVSVAAKRWSLAEAINVGVMASRNPVVAKVDADIVIAKESGPGLDAAAAACREAGGLAIVQTVDLPEGLEARAALTSSTAELLRLGRLRPRWGQGGLCIFAVDDWNEIGGFDSRYHGWGNEDNDFANRVRRSGRRVSWTATDSIRIFHIWHPPSYAAKDIVKARSQNRQIFAEDRSILRPIRLLSCSAERIQSPNIANRPRPLVTVAIASKARKNRLRMLGEAIRGFAGQIDGDFEVLVADNGSTAEERAELGKAVNRLGRSAGVRVVHLDRGSIPAARNRLTDEARGRYICVADDDDIPLPNRLRDHLAAFEKDGGLHGSHGGWIDFDELTGVTEYNTGGERTIATMLFGRGKVTAHPASFYRRDVMAAIRYDESIRAGSDLDLAVRVANLGCRIGHTGSYVTLRRFHEANITLTDLAGQLAVGVDSRQRVRETLGSAFEMHLREVAKKARAEMPCRNGIGRDRVIGLLPGYAGVWRLLVPLAELGRQQVDEMPWRQTEGGDNRLGQSDPVASHRGSGSVVLLDGEVAGEPDRFRPPAAELASRADLVERASLISELVKGEVGVVDSGINPTLYVVSDPIKGAQRALKLRQEVEKHLGVAAEVIADVEYERRRSKKFDWATVLDATASQRLVSPPSRDLGQVLAALGRIPEGTMLRAMTSFVADFNCEDQLFQMVTVPIKGGRGLADVRRFLETQTGESFEILAEARVA